VDQHRALGGGAPGVPDGETRSARRRASPARSRRSRAQWAHPGLFPSSERLPQFRQTFSNDSKRAIVAVLLE